MSDPVEPRRSGRVEMALPVRVRGMSKETKFFDEATETVVISKNGFMTRLLSRVDLETEVHVTSLTNNRSGTFRVAWISDPPAQPGLPADGRHNLGLELIEAEGDLWGVRFPSPEAGPEEAAVKIRLTCRKCRQDLLTDVPEAEFGPLAEGFLLARNCEKCRATTTWEYSPEGAEKPTANTEAEAAAVAPSAASSRPQPNPRRTDGPDLRQRRRVPFKMRIRVTRQKFGIELEDVCDTVNVSRQGAYFLTSQHYEAGESVRVVLGFKEGEKAIPVRARVARTDFPRDSHLHGVAVHLDEERPGALPAATGGQPQ